MRHCDQEEEKTLPIGKWLAFKSYNKIDETWGKIREAVTSQSLGGCTLAKVSTMRYNPSGGGTGPSTCGVICVYTKQHNMDAIGFKLIELVQQDIRYKLDVTTRMGKYSHSGDKVSEKTIFWNGGEPAFESNGSSSSGFSSTEDIWHLNIVHGPEPMRSEVICGRWIVSLKSQELTGYWHILKTKIESTHFGAVKMVCPSKRHSRNELPVFHIFTSRENKDVVGRKLMSILGRDMEYKGLTADRQPFTEKLHCRDILDKLAN